MLEIGYSERGTGNVKDNNPAPRNNYYNGFDSCMCSWGCGHYTAEDAIPWGWCMEVLADVCMSTVKFLHKHKCLLHTHD